ncbi:hypothetical protein ACQKLN_11015 [Paenibacillus glucanolyticus]|uniref:hypothetical protein n=1 Tax=Paenibacillus glucanolyticus TaxID=59843 RepID=UPI0034CECF61
MTDYKSAAKTWCEFYRPDRTCELMDELQSQSNPICKCYRLPTEDCRYLRLVVLNEKGKRRDG